MKRCMMAGAALAVAVWPALAQSLSAPFAQRQPDMKATSRSCEGAPAPVIGFEPGSKYGDAGSRRDSVDAEAEAAFDAAMEPIRDFAHGVVKSANDYHRSGRMSAASCALDHLLVWAKADALKNPGTHTAWFKLATTLSGLSLAYLQVKPAIAARSADARVVEAWLQARGAAVAGYFETLKTPRSSRNNHRAWAGLAAASAALASGDRGLLARGMESYRVVVCQATEEGALPLELERGRKAAEYHLYALAALVPLAEIGARNGNALHDACNGALARTVRFTLDALADTRRIAELAGTQQEKPDVFAKASRLVFLEPWLARHPDQQEAARRWLKKRPLGLTDLGGNQTLLYGSAL